MIFIVQYLLYNKSCIVFIFFYIREHFYCMNCAGPEEEFQFLSRRSVNCNLNLNLKNQYQFLNVHFKQALFNITKFKSQNNVLRFKFEMYVCFENIQKKSFGFQFEHDYFYGLLNLDKYKIQINYFVQT